jgi:5-methylcytosine-specific restriction endonuclease McrA
MKRADPFYSSPAWRAVRARALSRDRFRCVVCGVSVAERGASRVDHIFPRRTHPHLALDLANLRTLCAAHDNQAHREKGAGGGSRVERFAPIGCGADGWPNEL